MTRKEAIEFIKNIIGEESGRCIGKEGFYAELIGYHIEALKMAISALEQQPCEDAISREAVIKKIDYEVKHYCKYLEGVDDKRDAKTHVALVSDNIREEVEQLPPVIQKPIECDDAISREDALMCLTGMFKLTKNYNPEELIALFSKRIKELPSVTVQRKSNADEKHVGCGKP